MLQTTFNGRVFKDSLANFMASTRKWRAGDILMPTDSPEFRLGIGTLRFSQLKSIPISDMQQAEFIANIGTTTNLTAVPASFADLAAVQTYLGTLRANAESRLDTIEAKLDATLTELKDADLMASA